MPVRNVTYKVSTDLASARRDAAKVAGIYKKAMSNVQTGAAKGTGGTGGTGGKASKSSGLAGALVGGIAGYASIQTVRMIADTTIEMSKAAVVAGNLETAFTNAFAAVNVDSKRMLLSLREASQGMSSDVALQQQAMKAMRLGVTNDIDEMSQLMRIAAKRGQEFGRTTTDAFNDITTGIGRLSPRILDNLGFLVKVDDAYAKYAKTLGIAKEEMTTVQQRQAILNEVLAQAAGEGEAQLDQYQALSSSIINLKVEMGTLINEGTPFLSFIEQIGTNANIAAGNVDGLTTSIGIYGLMGTLKKGIGSMSGTEKGTALLALGIPFIGPAISASIVGGSINKEAQGSGFIKPWTPAPPQPFDSRNMPRKNTEPIMVVDGVEIPLSEYSNYLAGQRAITARDEFDKAAKSISGAGEDFAATISGMLDKVPGLLGTSPVTQQQLDDADAGIPQRFADSYLRELRDEVINGVDRPNVSIEEAAEALGLAPGFDPKAALRQFGAAWEDSSLFADPENLKFIDVEAVQAAMAKQADSEKGIENVKAMFGIGDEDAIAGLKAVGVQIYNPLAQGMQEEITDKGEAVGELLAATVVTGFTTGVFNVSWLAIIAAAMQSEVNDETSEEIHEDLQDY